MQSLAGNTLQSSLKIVVENKNTLIEILNKAVVVVAVNVIESRAEQSRAEQKAAKDKQQEIWLKHSSVAVAFCSNFMYFHAYDFLMQFRVFASNGKVKLQSGFAIFKPLQICNDWIKKKFGPNASC